MTRDYRLRSMAIAAAIDRAVILGNESAVLHVGPFHYLVLDLGDADDPRLVFVGLRPSWTREVSVW